jgi:hypothetical protein
MKVVDYCSQSQNPTGNKAETFDYGQPVWLIYMLDTAMGLQVIVNQNYQK